MQRKKQCLWEHRIFERIYIKIFHAIRIACKPLKNDKSQSRNLITQQNIPKRCSHFRKGKMPRLFDMLEDKKHLK